MAALPLLVVCGCPDSTGPKQSPTPSRPASSAPDDNAAQNQADPHPTGTGENDARAADQRRTISDADVVGTWTLVEFAGEPPEVHQIGTFSATFSLDNTWSYSASMAGRWEGTSMNGSGEWSVVDDRIRYTAGDNSGTSVVSLRDGRLLLDPDPVLRVGGTGEGVGVYLRAEGGGGG